MAKSGGMAPSIATTSDPPAFKETMREYRAELGKLASRARQGDHGREPNRHIYLCLIENVDCT